MLITCVVDYHEKVAVENRGAVGIARKPCTTCEYTQVQDPITGKRTYQDAVYPGPPKRTVAGGVQQLAERKLLPTKKARDQHLTDTGDRGYCALDDLCYFDSVWDILWDLMHENYGWWNAHIIKTVFTGKKLEKAKPDPRVAHGYVMHLLGVRGSYYFISLLANEYTFSYTGGARTA